MSTVYVTSEMKYDFMDAERYGAITFLTNGDLHNIKGSMHNDDLLREIGVKLKSFDPEQDWLVVTGSVYVSAAIFMLLGARGFSGVRVLRWSNRDRKYVPLYINLPKG